MLCCNAWARDTDKQVGDTDSSHLAFWGWNEGVHPCHINVYLKTLPLPRQYAYMKERCNLHLQMHFRPPYMFCVSCAQKHSLWSVFWILHPPVSPIELHTFHGIILVRVSKKSADFVDFTRDRCGDRNGEQTGTQVIQKGGELIHCQTVINHIMIKEHPNLVRAKQASICRKLVEGRGMVYLALARADVKKWVQWCKENKICNSWEYTWIEVGGNS